MSNCTRDNFMKLVGTVVMAVVFAVVFGNVFADTFDKAFDDTFGDKSAYDSKSLSSVLKPGAVLISPTFSYGGFGGDNIKSFSTISGTLSIDYVPNMSMPLTFGIQSGVSTVLDYGDIYTSFPILARVGWHPNFFGSENTDIYATFKVGYSIYLADAENMKGGISFGANVGYRYFFSDNIGVFTETGYDRYGISHEFGNSTYYYYYNTYAHAGVTFAFGNGNAGISSRRTTVATTATAIPKRPSVAVVDPSAVVKGTVTDPRDNRTYRTVTIGSQTWMAENLNYKTDNGSSCSYGKKSNCETYGRLYNWNAAKESCPVGWRLPDDGDWDYLYQAIGGSSVVGNKLKSEVGWNSNGNGTNVYGFSALPGGYRYSDGYSGHIGNSGRWWSATERDQKHAHRFGMDHNVQYLDEGYADKKVRFSIRCIRND